MGWLQEQKDKDTARRYRIYAVIDAYEKAGIAFPRELLASLERASAEKTLTLEDCLHLNLLNSGTFKRRSTLCEIQFGIDGGKISAHCWVPDVINYEKDPDATGKISKFIVEPDQDLITFLAHNFRGSVTIIRHLENPDEIPAAIAEIYELIDQIVEFVGD